MYAQTEPRSSFWPALPIIISVSCESLASLDNFKAALNYHDHVCQIKLFVSCELKDIIASLEEPSPLLTDLDLTAIGSFRPFDPDPSKFLVGSARLQSLTLNGLWIPDLLKLFLSTPKLVILRLDGIYTFSSLLPSEMVTRLSEFGRFYPDWENRRLPLLARTVIPSLTMLIFRGAIENLGDFVV